MLMEEFLKNTPENFNDSFFDMLPTQCPDTYCMYPLEINDTLTEVTCSNPYCPSRIIKRTQLLVKDLELDELLNEEDIADLVHKGGWTSPLAILYCSKSLFSYEVMKRMSSLKEYTSLELLKLAHIPYVEDILELLVKDEETLSHFSERMLKGGVELIERELVKETYTYSAICIYENLLRELGQIPTWVPSTVYDGKLLKNEPILYSTKKLKIICLNTLKGSPFSSLQEFYKACRQTYSKLDLEFVSEYEKGVNCIITEEGYIEGNELITKCEEEGSIVLNMRSFVGYLKELESR